MAKKKAKEKDPIVDPEDSLGMGAPQRFIDTIQFYPNPVHGSVNRAKGILNDFVALNVDLTNYQDTDQFNTIFYEQVKNDPKTRAKYIEFTRVMGTYQTIMLATTLTLEDIQDLAESIPYSDFEELLAKSIETIGGDAVNFLNGCDIDLDSRIQTARMRKRSHISTS